MRGRIYDHRSLRPESPDSGSVRERLPNGTRNTSSSPVEETQRKEGAKVIKKKRPWSSQKSNQDTKENVDMELLKTAKSIAEGFQADQRTFTEIDNSFYCKSMARRMRSLDPQSKACVIMQIEQLMFQVQFGGKVSNSSLPGLHLSQGPYSNPSHCNRQGPFLFTLWIQVSQWYIIGKDHFQPKQVGTKMNRLNGETL